MKDTEQTNLANEYPRCSGILAHITSLPSPYGIGDMGSGTYDFIRFLKNSEQSIWQILPLGPTDAAFSHSPYMTISAFAGNPLLISPELLCESGLITQDEIDHLPKSGPYSVDFQAVTKLKRNLLKIAFSRFREHALFKTFVDETEWLSDYSLFRALKLHYSGSPWYSWDSDLVKRKPQALEKATKQLEHEVAYCQFEQFIYFQQWQKLHDFATEHGIQIFGDIPIYISLDSSDVWSNQSIFKLDATTGRPTHVAGVPPDYFSETGQKWGNPLYRWHTKNKPTSAQLMRWWIFRFRHVFQQVDIARIDHFRGFDSYWSVPEEHKTALNGKWCNGPGKKFFVDVFEELGPLNIVAEDLGEITKDVVALREELGFPGMKVLQFAFDDNSKNEFLPHNFTSTNAFIYTGTHDNDTSVGWFLSERLDDTLRQRIKKISNRDLRDHHGIHRDLIYLAMSSIAAVCIIPLQDVLGFGSDCRMNTPGTDKGNWLWRCSEEFITDEVSSWLSEQTTLFRRAQVKAKNDTTTVS